MYNTAPQEDKGNKPPPILLIPGKGRTGDMMADSNNRNTINFMLEPPNRERSPAKKQVCREETNIGGKPTQGLSCKNRRVNGERNDRQSRKTTKNRREAMPIGKKLKKARSKDNEGGMEERNQPCDPRNSNEEATVGGGGGGGGGHDRRSKNTANQAPAGRRSIGSGPTRPHKG